MIEAVDGLVDHRQQDAVGDEPGVVVGLGRRLAESEGEIPGDLERLLRGRQPGDDLDQLHHRHGVHEVHADDPVRPPGLGGDAADGDGGGVGGQDRFRFAELIELAEDLELDLLILGGRLDHDVGRGHVLEADAAADPPQEGVLVRGGHLALLDVAGQDAGDGLQPLVDEFLPHVVHDDGEPAGGRHLGDAVAHLAGADDAECLYLHCCPPSNSLSVSAHFRICNRSRSQDSGSRDTR